MGDARTAIPEEIKLLATGGDFFLKSSTQVIR
jgi:hypothetical protein